MLVTADGAPDTAVKILRSESRCTAGRAANPVNKRIDLEPLTITGHGATAFSQARGGDTGTDIGERGPACTTERAPRVIRMRP